MEAEIFPCKDLFNEIPKIKEIPTMNTVTNPIGQPCEAKTNDRIIVPVSIYLSKIQNIDKSKIVNANKSTFPKIVRLEIFKNRKVFHRKHATYQNIC